MSNLLYGKVVRYACTLTRMTSDALEQGLAAEVRAEMGRQKIAARAMQRAIGISASAWGYYFVRCTRHIPAGVIFQVADVLGVPASTLIARAERNLAPEPDPIEAGMSRANWQRIANARAADPET